MGKKKIVIDTNLFISALGWGGTPKDLIDRVIQEEPELYMSERQWEELKTVLDYPKFCFTEDQKERFILVLSQIAHLLKTEELQDIVNDPKDHCILEPASTMRIDYIVTGDDDLLRLGTFQGAIILNASDFLKK
ncbi:MAG: putative toxin-antitoxin system toxin component, PIN family [Nanoarchaeota archaeon]